jgi:hypothetical protein
MKWRRDGGKHGVKKMSKRRSMILDIALLVDMIHTCEAGRDAFSE